MAGPPHLSARPWLFRCLSRTHSNPALPDNKLEAQDQILAEYLCTWPRKGCVRTQPRLPNPQSSAGGAQHQGIVTVQKGCLRMTYGSKAKQASSNRRNWWDWGLRSPLSGLSRLRLTQFSVGDGHALSGSWTTVPSTSSFLSTHYPQ